MEHQHFIIPNSDWLYKALKWADAHFENAAFYQNNGIAYPHKGFKNYLAMGSTRISFTGQDDFDLLRKNQGKWLFGYLGYDLKNQIEVLSSKNRNPLDFPEINFFEPDYLFEIDQDKIILIKGDESIIDTIDHYDPKKRASVFKSLKPDFSKTEYVATVKKLIDHIVEGDCYEINFCQGFYGHLDEFDAIDSFFKLNTLSPKPFSCFQKFSDNYILCASPERFLKKEGVKLVSQPIKGTRPRGHSNAEDVRLKEELKTDKKEKAENLMIVDLVRNDLARSSKTGSVKVEELFGIYSFRQVHQMISTVSSELEESLDGVEAIKRAFPMGSMTGAPKFKVMQLIEQYERSKRGAFSGGAGYFSPDGNFDFNVLIRSLFVNMNSKTYGYEVGSAITFDALAENEYDECLVKAKALQQLIND